MSTALSDFAMLTINPATISSEDRLKIRTSVRLKKLLQREKQGYIRVLHARTGVGLTSAEFSAIVQSLVDECWCFFKEGRQGGVLVVLNEQAQ